MAASSTAAAALSSCSLGRRSAAAAAADPSMLSASRSMRPATPLLRPLPTANRRLSALPQRRVAPRAEAKKQTFNSFDDLLQNSNKPVLVDFYATWCGPCQFMVPILEQVGDKLKDKIQVVKIDTEKYTKIADRYGIAALPTFIIFRDGEPCDRFEGAMSADELIQRIETALKVPQ